MPVRRLTDADALPYRRLTASAFGGSVDESAPQSFRTGEVPLGIDSTDRPGGLPGVLAAALRVRDDRIVLGGREVRCGGISGLAVHPAHRGQGLFGELLRAAVRQCAQDGQGLSMLYPSHPGIYRSAGWQLVHSVQELVVSLPGLATLPRPAGLHLAPVTDAVFGTVRELYRQAIDQENAMLVREGPLFSPRLPGGAFEAVLVVDEDGTARGYMSFDRVQAPAGEPGLRVHEIIAPGPAERIALLRGLGSWSTVSPTARIRLLADDPVMDAIPHGAVTATCDPLSHVMLRVTDAPTAITERGAPAGLEGRLLLHLEDPFVPGTGGCWTLDIGGGTVSCSPAADPGDVPGSSSGPDVPAVRLDVRALALLLAGGRGVREVRRAGLPLEADPAGAALLDALVAGPRPSVMDFF